MVGLGNFRMANQTFFFFDWDLIFLFFFFSIHFCFLLEGKSQQLREPAKFCFEFVTWIDVQEFSHWSNFLFVNSCELCLAGFQLFWKQNWVKISYTLEETKKTTNFQKWWFFWNFHKIYIKKWPTSTGKWIFQTPVFGKSTFCSSSSRFCQNWTFFFKKRVPKVTKFTSNRS